MTVEELATAIAEAFLASSGISEGDDAHDTAWPKMETLGTDISTAIESYVAAQAVENEWE